ncbi:U4/U6 small nuclear ribonucleoprotein PRP4 family [Trichomonas vaginalis G3]|uniref:U4/U6 small nuclear ribonucleoprotein PRP4 family n=1 Tax=Trichomonas vaginalis (strain ATCC PRA-98 / G3) TaxID=412133 RepID=UPI0021E5ABCA|nr:U4/U6 small nuclear ribonucleoprotein PRP4 family [Trichomonas vaginalis G3]KAI5502996.1 U4/U6 small nuclear ribonucleoprotein PRP4 family [Trichomonas vaginalis G3]
MSENLISSQVLGFRPNSLTAFATTHASQHESNLFAYAAEHAIVIYDRIMYYHKIILTPDPTSPIVALTFFGRDSLYCCNSKGDLFHYSIMNYKDGPIETMNIKCCPSSMTASNQNLFIISGSCIYILSVTKPFDKSNLVLLTNTQSHLEVSVSPCGRAMAAYARNGPSPVLWYAPYEKGMRSALPLKVNVIDFQWACTQYLTAVTCDANNAVRIWAETKNTTEMRCIAYYTFQVPIHSIAVMLPHDRWHNPRPYVARQNKSVFPLVLQPNLLISASLSDEIVLLEQTIRPYMRKVGSIPYQDNNTVLTVGDLSYIYSERQIKRQIHALKFSKTNLTFMHIELGENTVLWSIPLIRHFIHAPVKKLFLQNDHYIAEYANGTFFDWSEEKMISPPQEEIQIQNNTVIYKNTTKLQLDFVPSSFVKYHDDEQTIAIAFSDKNICGCLFGSKNIVIPADPPQEKIDHVSVHSSDLFAASTKSAVYIYFYMHKKYEMIAKKNFVNPRCFFLPHSLILLAINYDDILDFFVVNRNSIRSAADIGQHVTPLRTTPIVSLSVMPNDAVFVSTNNALFKVNIHKSNIPQPVKTGSKVFLTCFTLCYFNALNKLANGEVPDVPDFLNRGDPEIVDHVYLRKEEFENEIPKEFFRVCQRLPPDWKNLDRRGMNCLIGNILAQETDAKGAYPLFGIWGLLTRNQTLLTKLISFRSIENLLSSMISIWLIDNELLKQFISNFIAQMKPSDNEFDDFILLCTCVGKNILSKKICLLYDQQKLANTIDLYITDRFKSKSADSGAYRALREHRPSLGSVFFIFKGDKVSAIRCLKDRPFLMLLVARLLDYNWKELIIKEFDDVYGGFYSKWWNDDREGAICVLKELDLPSAKVVSSEFHRYQILLELGVEERRLILSLQPYAVFAAVALTQVSSDLQDQIENKETEQIEEPKPTKTEEEEKTETDDDMNFDFGGGNYIESDFDKEYSYSDSEEVETKEDEPNAIKVPPKNVFKRDELDIISRLINTFTRSPHVIPQRVPLGTNQHYIAGLIARLFSGRQPEPTSLLLEEIATKLYQNESTKYLSYVVIFALMEAKHLPNMIGPLFDGLFDQETFDIFLMQSKSHQTFIYPDLLTAFVANDKSEVTHNDRRVISLLAINRLMDICKPFMKKPLEPLFAFIHTRYRRYFSLVKNFTLSRPNFCVGLDPIDNKAEEHIKSMNATKMAHNYRISISDDFMSPFYSDGEFECTRSFLTNSRVGNHHVRDIVINPCNNKNVVLVAKTVCEVMITQEDLDMSLNGNKPVMKAEEDWLVVDLQDQTKQENTENTSSYDDNFDSHFTSLLEHVTFTPDKVGRTTRYFNMHWHNQETNLSDIKALCCSSHPTKPSYIVGGFDGKLYCADFGQKKTRSYMTISDSSINQIRFNRCGDKILCNCENGNVVISDFTSAFQPLLKPRDFKSLDWLNNDTQFVICGNQGIGIVDTIVGDVVCEISSDLDGFTIPCSVWGPYIATGCQNGSVNIFDVRMCKLVSSLTEHSNSVTTIRFDESGCFLLSGSSDNTIYVIDGLNFTTSSKINDVLGHTTSSNQSHSILSLAISNQVIVAGGYSPVLRAWTISEPRVID